VSSGEEALRYIKNNQADLLVLDMIMSPGIDGLETYKKILKFNPNQKAVIASGYSESGRVKEAQKLGAGAYIKKPYSFEAMGLAVKGELAKISDHQQSCGYEERHSNGPEPHSAGGR
jgi:YesN/AraC family two-component response regulator